MLIGIAKSYILERRILLVTLLGSSVVSTLIFIQAILSQYPPVTRNFIIGVGIVFWSLYFFARYGKGHLWIPWVFLFTGYLICLIDWFLLAGFTGVGLLVFTAMTSLMPMLIHKKYLPIAIGMNIITMVLICIGVMYFPYVTQIDVPIVERVWEKVVETIIISSGLFFIIFIVMREHYYEKEKIHTLNEELTAALQEVKTLRGLIPICSQCKKVRNDSGLFENVEVYLKRHTDVDLSHTLCPECVRDLYGEEVYRDMLNDADQKEPRDT